MRGMSRERTSVGATRSRPPSKRRVRRRLKRNPACVAVRRPVGDERERSAAVPLDLERRGEPVVVPRERAEPRPGEGEVAGAAAVRATAEIVDGTHDLRVEPDAGGEAEAAAVHASDADAARSSGSGEPASRLRGSPRDPESPRQHARATSGDEPERGAVVDAVQHLVERAVPTEDVQRGDRARDLARDLGRVPARTGEPELRPRGQLGPYAGEPVLVDA